VAEEGTVILKFWLHVDKDEQIKRFREREKDPLRVWKIGPEDYRNREKFDQYVEKADAMFKETHRPWAPWILVPGNDKRYARVRVLESVVEALEQSPVTVKEKAGPKS
jgi:AMP-polyphosphate phosphotransferase